MIKKEIKIKSQQFQKSFSVTELMVVVGIMMVLTALSVPSIGKATDSAKINRTAEQILATIYKARSKAYAPTVEAAGKDAYGVYFTKNISGSGVHPLELRVAHEDRSDFEIIEQIEFPKGIIISNLDPSNPGDPDHTWLYFKIGSGQMTYLDWNPTDWPAPNEFNDHVTITIQSEKTLRDRQIRINRYTGASWIEYS